MDTSPPVKSGGAWERGNMIFRPAPTIEKELIVHPTHFGLFRFISPGAVLIGSVRLPYSTVGQETFSFRPNSVVPECKRMTRVRKSASGKYFCAPLPQQRQTSCTAALHPLLE